jgi:hypothetical protein
MTAPTLQWHKSLCLNFKEGTAMNTLNKALCAAALLAPLAALAQLSEFDRKRCQSNYKDAVTQCAKGLSFLEPNTRAGAQKACLQTAQTKRDACLQGPGLAVCLESCQAVYDQRAQQCEATYATDYPNCGGGFICQGVVGFPRFHGRLC